MKWLCKIGIHHRHELRGTGRFVCASPKWYHICFLFGSGLRHTYRTYRCCRCGNTKEL